MAKIKNLLRHFLWKILGVDYNHILKSIDSIYLKEDKYKWNINPENDYFVE